MIRRILAFDWRNAMSACLLVAAVLAAGLIYAATLGGCDESDRGGSIGVLRPGESMHFTFEPGDSLYYTCDSDGCREMTREEFERFDGGVDVENGDSI